MTVLLYIGILLAMFLSPTVAVRLGIGQVGTASSLLLVVLSFLTIIINKFDTLVRKYKEELFIIVIAIIIISIKYSLNDLDGAQHAIFFIIVPMLISILLGMQNANVKQHIKKIILLFFILECLLSIYERVFLLNIFPNVLTEHTVHSQIANRGIFRSSAFLGHALNNALCVAVILGYILVAQKQNLIKIFLVALGLLSLLCFNARAAALICTFTAIVYLIHFVRKNHKKNVIRSFFLLILAASMTYLSYYFMVNYELGGRLLQGELMDGSAMTRVNVLDAFNYINDSDFWLGNSANYLPVMYNLNALGVENSYVVIIINYGIVMSICLFIAYFFWIKRLLKPYSRFDKFIILVTFIIVGSTNNGLAASTPWLFFILCSHSFRKKKDVNVNSYYSNYNYYNMGINKYRIAVVGLGYVGLPIAVEFAKKYKVLGFDIDDDRIKKLIDGIDHTHEVDVGTLNRVIRQQTKKVGLTFSSDVEDLRDYNVFIVTVPTPVDRFNNPDLQPLINASAMLGGILSEGDIVIYESTVYPGCTEEVCVPVLETSSGLKYNVDFFCGYSPERINPGDKINTLTNIKKVTSGSTPEIAEVVDNLYNSVIEAGTHKAPSIKVAEASKAVENAQRDLNISFVNELAIIFDRIGIDTNDVLEAAATKWNFMKYKPGLVGGHCIGVDPYYLAQKAVEVGYHPEVILSGRRINDQIAVFIANKTVKLMIEKGHKIKDSCVLIMGITFKENCPDIRNTKVVDVYKELKKFGINVEIYDPWADPLEVKEKYDIDLKSRIDDSEKYEAIIVTVAHYQFREFDFRRYNRENTVIFDVKAFIDRELVDSRL